MFFPFYGSLAPKFMIPFDNLFILTRWLGAGPTFSFETMLSLITSSMIQGTTGYPFTREELNVIHGHCLKLEFPDLLDIGCLVLDNKESDELLVGLSPIPGLLQTLMCPSLQTDRTDSGVNARPESGSV